jgi:hypothetical protein
MQIALGDPKASKQTLALIHYMLNICTACILLAIYRQTVSEYCIALNFRGAKLLHFSTMGTGARNLHTATRWCTVWSVETEGQTAKVISTNISSVANHEN